MLNELAKYNEIGKQNEIIYFLKSILRPNLISIKDIELLCIHGVGNRNLKPDVLLVFFNFIGIVDIDNTEKVVALSAKGLQIQGYDNEAKILEKIVEYTVNESFTAEVLSENHFSFDDANGSFIFRSERMALTYSAIRNLLIECEFLIPRSDSFRYILEVNSKYETLLTRNVSNRKKHISLEQLKEQLARNEENGEKAEKFVLDFEKRRLAPHPNADKVKQISSVDVSAGYDIISFNSQQSEIYDRYIEVKAICSGFGFYWSINEIQTAKLKSQSYYLYLVDLSKIGLNDYEPCIIHNPADNLIGSDEWLFEAQSYHVRKV